MKKADRLVKTLPTLGKEYRVSFDIFINSFNTGWESVLHLTATGKDCCNYGDRVPAVFINGGSKKFHISSALNGNGNSYYNVPSSLRTGEWINVEISQSLINNKV